MREAKKAGIFFLALIVVVGILGVLSAVTNNNSANQTNADKINYNFSSNNTSSSNTTNTTNKTTVVDITPPVTTDDAPNISVTHATVTLTCVDNVGGSGCARTYYLINNGNTQIYTTPLNFSSIPGLYGVAEYNLVYYSIDRAGNMGKINTAVIQIVNFIPSGNYTYIATKTSTENSNLTNSTNQTSPITGAAIGGGETNIFLIIGVVVGAVILLIIVSSLSKKKKGKDSEQPKITVE